MNARRNALNDIYQQYDSEMNSQHSIDLVHPPPFLSSMPSITPVNPSIKSAKEESEHEYIYVSHFIVVVVVAVYFILSRLLYQLFQLI